MNKLFETFTSEARGKFLAAFEGDSFKNLIEQTKAATDSGGFRVVISTPAVDRQGESVDQNLWDLESYLKNPVVLWAHDYGSLPIGVATNLEKQVVDGQAALVAEGKFAPEEANPFAQQVRRLYDAGILRATSVGFIPSSMRMDGKSESGNELLEFSFVPVPANAEALSLAQAQKLGLNLGLLAVKGIIFEKAEEPEEGDACELDGGGEGVLERDGNGDLVCVPKKSGDKNMKAGRTISSATCEKLQAIHDLMAQGHEMHEKAIGALKELIESALPGSAGEDKPEKTGSPKQRSAPSGSREISIFEDWKMSREVLQEFVTAASNALERFNETARELARQK